MKKRVLASFVGAISVMTALVAYSNNTYKNQQLQCLVLEGINANAQQGSTDWEDWLKKLTKGLENLGNDNDKKYDVDEDETDREVQCTDEEYTSQNQNGTTTGKIDSEISGGVNTGFINV